MRSLEGENPELVSDEAGRPCGTDWRRGWITGS